MSRKFIATIVAAAVTVTTLASAPARADEDVVKFVMGAAALYFLSQALDDDRPTVSSSSNYYRPKPRPLPKKVRRNLLLPAECLRQHQTRHGNVRVLGQRCLEKNYRHVNSLPRKCHVKINTYNGKRKGFKPRCLRNNGYRLAQY